MLVIDGLRTEALALQHATDWQAALIPAPQTPEQAASMLETLTEWGQQVSAQPPSCTEVFLQVWRMGAAKAAAKYAQNLQRWWPMASFGVWPGRAYPQRATQEMAMDCAAAVLTNEELPLAAHSVAHVSAGPTAGKHALDTMFGLGMTVQMVFTSAQLASRFPETSRSIFRSAITDTAFQNERYYLPLFDAALLARSTDAELDHAMCGASIYLRESPEDRSVLILRRSSAGAPHEGRFPPQSRTD